MSLFQRLLPFFFSGRCPRRRSWRSRTGNSFRGNSGGGAGKDSAGNGGVGGCRLYVLNDGPPVNDLDVKMRGNGGGGGGSAVGGDRFCANKVGLSLSAKGLGTPVSPSIM